MGIIPLTMARQTVAYVSTTSIGKFLPLHKIVAVHIHIGYIICVYVFVSAFSFFTFYGIACRQQITGNEPCPGGVRTFCKKLQSEIMITGIVILGCSVLVACTSFLRNRIKYEIFYVVHHLTLVIFAVAGKP
jgi:predicted ferric reductase